VAIKYVPKPLRSDFQESREDREYARAFNTVASILESSPNSEMLALRLSTCRNGYLTVNALFVDLQQILGHGRKPSLLSAAIEHLRRGEHDQVGKMLNEVRVALDAYEKKRRVWTERETLDEELTQLLDNLKPVERDDVRALVGKVRTENPRTGKIWDSAYYELTTEDTAKIREHIEFLYNKVAAVEAIVDVARAMLGIPLTNGLFDTEHDGWKELISVLGSVCDRLGASIYDTGDLVWTEGDGTQVNFPAAYPGKTDSKRLMACLSVKLSKCERILYDAVADHFQPNVGIAPLPEPFKVDLTERSPVGVRRDGGVTVAKKLSCQQSPTTIVRVAALECGMPLECYDGNRFRYINDERRHFANELAMTATKVANQHGAAAIVFPEYFLPRDRIDEYKRLSSELQMTVVSGLEGTTTPETSPLLVNEAIVFLPGRPPERQGKRRPSIYEPPIYSDGELKVFEQSVIGNFAVVVCSDLRDLDVMTSLSSCSTRMDILFVCSLNPNPAQFSFLAKADASRLYCHVMVANNLTKDGERERASAEGTSAFSPKRNAEEMSDTGSDPISLGMAKIGGVSPAIRLFELSLEEVARNRQKPANGYLPVPDSRRG